jgi:hypothetical protein
MYKLGIGLIIAAGVMNAAGIPVYVLQGAGIVDWRDVPGFQGAFSGLFLCILSIIPAVVGGDYYDGFSKTQASE